MRYEELCKLNKTISLTREPGKRANLQPVINTLLPSQRFLIISSDPSSDTNKGRELLEKHSDFEERVISLFFFGRDGTDEVCKIREHYKTYKSIFLKNYYWTHFSKVYAAGNPGGFWAKKFLIQEIKLFEPQVIVIFGGIAANFLLGKDNLRKRVNKKIDWNGTPTICSLHPSKDWNLRRREDFDFDATWDLIRSVCQIDEESKKQLAQLSLATWTMG